ncbi:beta carbonic anhydrase 2, chloroplastic-like isoform X2 [Selaginella moellendorffii]|uniref:beta carbonic anhydrase 2, chloroplastic-like isoform X2 n=1 Tax=Selaginella moellendorffii TaxID=88036 RepID=UPI000D1CEDDA|nr:beta carbonic anhydrase 2, chloroplastic-like isoform X2 [Selaginella moellendorffii]|eukprot:XP_024530172.1 beta carbonic anhydrase 2, chloroplastic-like isoform X2 [Selaginella moellendorffii]
MDSPDKQPHPRARHTSTRVPHAVQREEEQRRAKKRSKEQLRTESLMLRREAFVLRETSYGQIAAASLLWIQSLGRCSVANIFTREFSTALVPRDPSPEISMSSLQRSRALPSSEFLQQKDHASNYCVEKPQNAAASLRKIFCSQQVQQTRLAPAERIKQGFQRFKQETYNQKPELFSQLATGQHPKFMVIACSDSRVCPTTILGFQPGEAFVVRNIANMVPPPEQAGYPGTSAALEYAVTALKVENILVIGHSRCGGIKALMTQKENTNKWSSFIEDWVEIGRPARAVTLAAAAQQQVEHQCTKCEKESVNVSLANLLAFPFIKEAVSSGTLALHGGYYNFVEGSFEYWWYGIDGKSEVSKF